MTTVEKKPRCKLIGTDGNIYALGREVSKALKDAGQKERAREFTKKLWACQSYSEALVLMAEYVDIY